MMAEWTLRAVTRLLALLPLRWMWRLGDALGRLTWSLDADAARITRINLQRCFPHLAPAEREALGRASLGHSWRLLLETGPLSHWPATRLQALLRVETGRLLIERRLAEKRGLLMLVSHFGNWEYLGYLLGGLDMVGLYDPPRIRALEAHLLRSRKRFGVRMAPVARGGLRLAYRKLQAGGVVALLPDQTPQPQAGVFAPFFGQPALTMTLAQRLVQKTGAAVLLGSVRRMPGGFAALYEPLDAHLDAGDAQAFATAVNRGIEKLVRRDPAQYQWEDKRVKRQPPGQPTPYPPRRRMLRRGKRTKKSHPPAAGRTERRGRDANRT